MLRVSAALRREWCAGPRRLPRKGTLDVEAVEDENKHNLDVNVTDISEDDDERARREARRMYNALAGGSLEEAGDALEALLVTPELGVTAEEFKKLGVKG